MQFLVVRGVEEWPARSVVPPGRVPVRRSTSPRLPIRRGRSRRGRALARRPRPARSWPRAPRGVVAECAPPSHAASSAMTSDLRRISRASSPLAPSRGCARRSRRRDRRHRATAVRRSSPRAARGQIANAVGGREEARDRVDVGARGEQHAAGHLPDVRAATSCSRTSSRAAAPVPWRRLVSRREHGVIARLPGHRSAPADKLTTRLQRGGVGGVGVVELANGAVRRRGYPRVVHRGAHRYGTGA